MSKELMTPEKVRHVLAVEAEKFGMLICNPSRPYSVGTGTQEEWQCSVWKRVEGGTVQVPFRVPVWISEEAFRLLAADACRHLNVVIQDLGAK